MSDIAWKRLGLVLLLGSVILAAVAVKMNHDQKQRSEEQRRNFARWKRDIRWAGE